MDEFICYYRLILSVRDTCVDWMRGVEPHDDPAMKGKKDPDEGFTIKVPRRNVGPSTTQVIQQDLAVRFSHKTHSILF